MGNSKSVLLFIGVHGHAVHLMWRCAWLNDIVVWYLVGDSEAILITMEVVWREAEGANPSGTGMEGGNPSGTGMEGGNPSGTGVEGGNAKLMVEVMDMKLVE